MKINDYIKKNKLNSLLLKKNFFFEKFNKSKFEKKVNIKFLGGYTIADLHIVSTIFYSFGVSLTAFF